MYIGCAVLLCLVCLFDLACFFSHLSFKNMYIYTCIYMHMCIIFANLFHKQMYSAYIILYVLYMYNYVKDVWSYVMMFLSINFTALQAPVQKS